MAAERIMVFSVAMTESYMDLYTGEVDALGRGHGAKIARQHVDQVFSLGVPAVGIDPHPDNRHAQRAFARAGFVTAGGPLDTRWGRAILMGRFAG